jgi:hypothetical protein
MRVQTRADRLERRYRDTLRSYPAPVGCTPRPHAPILTKVCQQVPEGLGMPLHHIRQEDLGSRRTPPDEPLVSTDAYV